MQVSFDAGLLLWIQSNLRSDMMTPFWQLITMLGTRGWFWIALAVILVTIPGTRRTGMTALLAMAVSLVVTNLLLKNLVARVRPYEVIEGLQLLTARQPDFSFPSGHTSAAFAAALTFYRGMPRRYGRLLVLLACLIAFSRLYLGVHYPSDVLGGIAVGILSYMAAPRLYEALAGRLRRRKPVLEKDSSQP